MTTNSDLITALPSAFRPSPLGLEITGDPTFADCAAAFNFLFPLSESVHLMLGDLLNYVEGVYPELHTAIYERCYYASGTLGNNQRICRAVPFSRRREGIPMSYYADLYTLPPTAQEKYIALAASGEFEKRQALRDRLKADGHKVARNAYDVEMHNDQLQAINAIQARRIETLEANGNGRAAEATPPAMTYPRGEEHSEWVTGDDLYIPWFCPHCHTNVTIRAMDIENLNDQPLWCPECGAKSTLRVEEYL